jgi:hypothetical protein
VLYQAELRSDQPGLSSLHNILLLQAEQHQITDAGGKSSFGLLLRGIFDKSLHCSELREYCVSLREKNKKT